MVFLILLIQKISIIWHYIINKELFWNKTYTITIYGDMCCWGNAQCTKNSLEKILKENCPGVTFVFSYEKANNNIGYPNPNSQVKIGLNTFTQGKTYKVIINSN